RRAGPPRRTRSPFRHLAGRDDRLARLRAQAQEARGVQAQIFAGHALAVAAHRESVARTVQRGELPLPDLVGPAGVRELAVEPVEQRLEQRDERAPAARLLLEGRRLRNPE